MLEIVNHQFLTVEERRQILDRALHSQVFQQLFSFDLAAAVRQEQQYSDKVPVNKDFYFTEIRGNFGEVFTITNSLFDVSLYSQLDGGKSLYRFQKTFLLPSGQVTTEARFNTAFAAQLFDDRQYEYIPRLIRAGDTVTAGIKNQAAKVAPTIAHMVLNGYYIKPDSYLSADTSRGVSESLTRDIRYENWQLEVNVDSKQTFKFDNDRTARLVLGFGIIDKNLVKANLSQATIQVRDSFKNIKWSNLPVPIEFLAPRLTALRDAHIYYLPIEYLFEPFSSLMFDVDNTLNGGSGFSLIMLTRTV